VQPLERWAGRSRFWRMLEPRKRPVSPMGVDGMTSHMEVSRDRAVVVGFGPTGRTVARLLAENDIEPVIVELNLDTFHELGRKGILSVYGDATHQDILKEAGVGD